MTRIQNKWTAILGVIVAGVVGAAALPGAAIAEGLCNGGTKVRPLQKFMRDNAGTPMAYGDLATVANSMDKLQAWGDPTMPNWANMAKKTADDARSNKTAEVKADCKACHDAYKDAYKKNQTLRNKRSSERHRGPVESGDTPVTECAGRDHHHASHPRTTVRRFAQESEVPRRRVIRPCWSVAVSEGGPRRRAPRARGARG